MRGLALAGVVALALACTMVAPARAAAPPDLGEIITNYDAGITGGDYQSAMSAGARLAKTTPEELGIDALSYADMMREMGRSAAEIGFPAEAYTFYARALFAAERVMDPKDPELVPYLLELSAVEATIGKKREARGHVMRALKLAAAVRGEDVAENAWLYGAAEQIFAALGDRGAASGMHDKLARFRGRDAAPPPVLPPPQEAEDKPATPVRSMPDISGGSLDEASKNRAAGPAPRDDQIAREQGEAPAKPAQPPAPPPTFGLPLPPGGSTGSVGSAAPPPPPPLPPAAADGRMLATEAPPPAAATAAPAAPPEPRSAVDDAAPFEKVVVFYGTSRLRAPECAQDPALCAPERVYGAERSEVEYGTVLVSMPKKRELGGIPKPSIWKGEFRPDPAKHVIVLTVTPKPKDGFFAEIRNKIETIGGRKEAFVFIHGFNTTFTEAAERTAQMAIDLEIEGAPIFYSWPSKGNLLGYIADGSELTERAKRQVEEFLRDVTEKSGAERVHLVAHSMGNRYLLAAMMAIARERAPSAPPLFDEVVFAAPDVDRQDFVDQLAIVRPISRRYTLYASKRDKALEISYRLNAFRRAGDASDPVILPWLETVDTTASSSGLIGHSDFAGTALDDFRAVLWLSLAPKTRCVLKSETLQAGTLWEFGDGTCPEAAFKAAIVLLRRLGKAETVALIKNQIDLVASAGDTESQKQWEQVLAVVQAI